MEYAPNIERLRMKVVIDGTDGGGGPGYIELRDGNRTVLATLVLTKPSFYLVGSSIHLVAPTSGFVTVAGQAVVGTISDAVGNLVIDELSVGKDITDDEVHDFEIVLDNVNLEVGKQVTIVSASIDHG